jgi:hypothetical protein
MDGGGIRGAAQHQFQGFPERVFGIDDDIEKHLGIAAQGTGQVPEFVGVVKRGFEQGRYAPGAGAQRRQVLTRVFFQVSEFGSLESRHRQNRFEQCGLFAGRAGGDGW